MHSRMLVLRLGYVRAALGNFPPATRKRGLIRAIFQTVKEVFDAIKPW